MEKVDGPDYIVDDVTTKHTHTKKNKHAKSPEFVAGCDDTQFVRSVKCL